MATEPDQKTTEADERDALATHGSTEVPTPEEERQAEEAAADVDVEQVAEHYEEMTEKGANAKGEGQIG